MLYVPAGYVVVDRAIGAEMLVGWRMVAVEDTRASSRFALLREHMSVYTDADTNSVLSTFKLAAAAIDKVAMPPPDVASSA